MAEPQDTQPDTPAGNLDARIEALEQYLAAQQVQTPTAQTQVPGALPASIDFAGGTIIHSPHVGSFHITSDTASRASFIAAGSAGDNFTPNFPAYPSGHATFGTACFETFAGLVGKQPKDIKVKFASDEFNGVTSDNVGALRPLWEQTFTLKEAIEQNKISRIYLGVHWDFDATGGETVGKAIAAKVVAAF